MSRAPNRHAYINWQESDEQGEMIIDEQHRAIVATINSFYYFLSQGYGVQELKPTLELLLKYMLFHLKTEEGILHTTEYPELTHYAEIQKSTITGLKEAIKNATQFNQPKEVLLFLKNWWLSHLKEHEAITPFCHNWSGEYCHVPE
ncbi:MAG TPA: hemerythrin domain-containing protein [Methylotenera sp.]|nr:hemerythrin domain-containing protein [Methylotenera sp.]